MKTLKGKAFEAQEFESLNEFAKYCEGEITKEFQVFGTTHEAMPSHGTTASEVKFTGSASFEEAMTLMKSGYKEGLENLKKAKTKLTECGAIARPRIKLDVVGFAPCVPNAIIGLPKSMIKRERVMQKSPIIDICYDVTLSCREDKRVLFEGGKNVLAAVKELEAQGLRVNLKIIMNTYVRSNAVKICKVVIKKATQALNPLLVSYPLTHPSFFRRNMLAWEEVSPLTAKGFAEGYGHPFYAHPDVKKFGASDCLKRMGALGKTEYYVSVKDAAKANNLEELFRNMGLVKDNKYVSGWREIKVNRD